MRKAATTRAPPGDGQRRGHVDDAAAGRRQVTLINERYVIGSGFMFHETRRNIVTRDTELMYLIGKEFMIGAALMRGVKYCDPPIGRHRPIVPRGKRIGHYPVERGRIDLS